MEDVLVQLEGGVEQRPGLVLKLVADLRFGNIRCNHRILEQLDKHLASLLVDEVLEPELVLFESHLLCVVAIPDEGQS